MSEPSDQRGDVAAAGLILVAAGRGTRLGAGLPKALATLGHGPDAAPIVVHALRAVLRCRALACVVVVAPPDPEGMQQLAAALDAAFPGLLPDRAHGVHAPTPDRAHGVHALTADRAHAVHGPTPDRAHAVHAGSGTQVRVTVVPGGAERADSVAAGLRALPPDVDVVLVHDAARALTPVEVFDRVVGAVRSGHPAVAPALPVTDTVKQVETGADGTETVIATVDRSTLRAVQTPQGFLRTTLERGHDDSAAVGSAGGAASPTDDCGMVEATGGRVTVVEGSPSAMKITTPHDLELAAMLLAARRGTAQEETIP